MKKKLNRSNIYNLLEQRVVKKCVQNLGDAFTTISYICITTDCKAFLSECDRPCRLSHVNS